MNRAERRTKEKEDRQQRQKMWPSGFVATDALPAGARFTIRGVRRLANGAVIFNCKDGDETVFVSQGPGEPFFILEVTR